MKKLFILTMLFTLPFIGCEKDCPECPVIEQEEELCWECITKELTRYYYCTGVSGQAQELKVLRAEMLCDLTQEQIDAKEEVNEHKRTVTYECGQTSNRYERITYTRYMTCTLLE